MDKKLAWGIASVATMFLFLPIGLIVFFGGLVYFLTSKKRDQKQQYMDDVHTIAEKMRKEERE